jgi:hypothetical protein
VKAFLGESPRSCATASVKSGSIGDVSRCTHSCRLGGGSSCESFTYTSEAGSSRCAQSCVLGSKSSCPSSSASTSRCTHSCRVGSQSSASGFGSSTSTTSSLYPVSHRSYRGPKLAGDILTELRASSMRSQKWKNSASKLDDRDP